MLNSCPSPPSERRWLLEWEQPSAIMMAWPERQDVWHSQALPVQREVLALANLLANFRPVLFVARTELHCWLKSQLAENIELIDLPYSDIWLRDIAPHWCRQGNQLFAWIWEFNAWHGLYPDVSQDRAFASALAELFSVPSERSECIIEPGNLTCDGGARIYSVWASIARNNSHYSQAEVTALLQKALGAEEVVWVQKGLEFDETGGHIDNLLQIIDAEHAIAIPHDELIRYPMDDHCVWLPAPPLLRLTKAQAQSLDTSTGAKRRGPEVPVIGSYVNVVALPEAIFVPQFGVKADMEAIAVMMSAFPERQIIPVEARELALGGGGPHCVTHTLPKDVWERRYNAPVS